MNDTSLYRALTTHTRADERTFLHTREAGPVSFVAFHRRSDAMAGVLHDLGVRRGDRVVVQVDKSIDAVAVYLATLRIGAVYVPLNPAYTATEVGRHIVDAEPSLCVGPDTVDAPSVSLGRLCEMVETSQVPPDRSAVDDEVATMLYTSGTTGRPKGAPATSRGLLTNARDLCDTWSFTGDDVLLHVLPLFHVHGLFVAMHCALLTGAGVRFHERFDADRAVEALPGATAFMGVPTMYRRMLDLAAARDAPVLDAIATRTMRIFTSGSAPMPAAMHDEFRRRTGHAVVERYGLTETGILTSNRLGAEKAGTVGHALPHVTLRVADRMGSRLAPGVPGEVQVKGPSVTPGYWRDPAATHESFTADGWFRTGDIGSADDDGRLTLLGRSRDVVISGGLNVYPPEVEAAILATGICTEVAVIGLPHPDLGEAVVAVSPKRLDGPVPALEDLAPYKRPKAWIEVPTLPRNAMGKVEKHELQRRHRSHFT